MSFLQDDKGNWSSKRFYALACFIVGTVLAFINGDPIVVGIFLAASTSVFIGQAVTHT